MIIYFIKKKKNWVNPDNQSLRGSVTQSFTHR